MYDILAMLVLTLISIPLACIMDEKIERVLPLSAGGIIFCGYISGLFNHIFAGMLLWIGAWTCIFLLLLVKKGIKRKRIFTPGLLFVWSSLLLLIVYHRYSVITVWDDLANWAISSKNMFFNDKFACIEGTTVPMYQDYLPGVQLFNVFWTKIGNSFSDSRILISENMLVYIMLGYLMSLYKENENKWKGIIFAVILYLSPLCFPFHMLKTLQIDIIIAAIFGIAVFQLINPEEEKNKWTILACIFMLCISKQIGGPLSLVLLAIMIWKEVYPKSKREKQSLMLLTGAAGLVLFTVLSWNILLKIHGIRTTGSSVYTSLLNDLSGYMAQIPLCNKMGFVNFWKAFINYDIIDITSQTEFYFTPLFKVPAGFWLLILTISYLILSYTCVRGGGWKERLCKKNRNQHNSFSGYGRLSCFYIKFIFIEFFGRRSKYSFII